MNKTLAYIGLQLKLNLSDDSLSKRGKIFSFILSFFVFIVIFALIFLLVSSLESSMNNNISLKSLSILFVFVTEILLTILAITTQIKNLFMQQDALITARVPLNNIELYVSGIVIGYINIFIHTVASFLPMMLVFGLGSGIETYEYYGFVFLATLFAPIIPYGISLLVAVPIMFIYSLFENKNIIKLLLFIGLIIAFFFIYDYILQTLASYLLYQQIEEENINLWSNIVTALDSKFNPFTYVRNILYKETCLNGIGITTLIGLLCFILGLTISIPTFNYVKNRTLEGSQNIFSRKTKYTNDNSFFAVLKKEFKEIIRTKVYAYFYLGIAISTPVMVFFCNRLTIEVGQAQIGNSVTLGASVLVLAAFMTLINAFSAGAINKEGDKFYITKIIPMKFTYQMLIKGCVNFLVSIGALVISCFVIVQLKFVTIEDMFVLLFGFLFMAVAIIFTGFNINLTSTQIKCKANGDVDEGNVTILMVLGLLLTGILATCTIFICYFQPKEYAYIPILLIPLLCMLINISIFFPTVEKRYYRIEASL